MNGQTRLVQVLAALQVLVAIGEIAIWIPLTNTLAWFLAFSAICAAIPAFTVGVIAFFAARRGHQRGIALSETIVCGLLSAIYVSVFHLETALLVVPALFAGFPVAIAAWNASRPPPC